jgi:endonuclease YncB( thermonuclease family)
MPATAALLLCVVVGITDGDTLTARCDAQTIKVRLSEVDGTDANGAQARAGMAWVFDRYVTDRTLYPLRDMRGPRAVGCVWADAQPVAPWQWLARGQTSVTHS